ncbi:MAG: hypothetical protein K6G73_12865 [Marinilabiliaceae bacterium]|nr:hypothetical protein [Marinilabiliaceae bacterium]
MKRALFLLAALFIVCTSMAPGRECITTDGFCKGIRLAGKVRIVDVGEDFKVRVVDVGEDLIVRRDDFATSKSKIGRWRFVDIGGDFKIRIVDVGEDFKIRYDDIRCGVRHPCR